MFEHANCGIGAIANLKGQANHQIIQEGITLLKALDHRGGNASDGTGDGCGILLQIPKAYYQNKYQFSSDFALMNVFLPNNDYFKQAEAIIKEVLIANEVSLIKAIKVEVDNSFLTKSAKASEPIVMQYLVETINLDAYKYSLIKTQIHQAFNKLNLSKAQAYIVSFSNKTLVYKGLLTPNELSNYYLDLKDEAYISNVCIVHQRFSTNTTPSWNLAQPFRYLAHNGEINTVSANIDLANGAQSLAKYQNLYPICDTQQSDSANLDAMLENMLVEGLDLESAITSLLPMAKATNYQNDQDLAAYFTYQAIDYVPWDGPAGVIASDGDKLIATIDRNGLRPFRYITTEDKIILASEIGVLNTSLTKIKNSKRLSASEVLVVDLNKQELINDKAIKAKLAKQQAYQSLIEAYQLVDSDYQEPSYPDYTIKFKYQSAEYQNELKSLVTTGKEAIGSFAYTDKLAMFKNSNLFYDYFKQNFAQVTNPPLDSIREKAMFDTNIYLKGLNAYHFTQPLITNNQYQSLLEDDCLILNLGFDTNLELALNNLELAVTNNTKAFIILDDESTSLSIPSLLALAHVHNTLVKLGKRKAVSIIVKSGDARLPMHYAMLLAYGADVIYPYYAYQYLLMQDSNNNIKTYLDGCYLSLLKLMAKMGISTLRAYKGSKVFEIVGLANEVSKYFTTSPSLIGGKTLKEIELELNTYEVSNEYLNNDNHAYSKNYIKDLKVAMGNQDYDQFKAIMDNEKAKAVNIRDYFKFKTNAINIDLVESEEAILTKFVASAMSYGALSLEAHRLIAEAFNKLKAKSNSGEGGELISRNHTLAQSHVRQIASGRFGVTYEYLSNAVELQIKMAQGAKPGEGGHLPKQKVKGKIAEVRNTEAGIDLISPPPHHDIYSIEDLAQLIYDLQTTNPQALISVKLASLANVGIIANGVVKAGASKVVISGFNGGTGASPLSSLKYTGLPWEYGLYQTHTNLINNQVRKQTIIQVDGQIKSAYDVISGAILGADEFGIGTMALIGLDCIGCKLCHTNKCPKGITTQDSKLIERLVKDSSLLETYLKYLAKHTRELLAELGYTSLASLKGQTQLISHEVTNLDLSWLQPTINEELKLVNKPYNNKSLTSKQNLVNTERCVGVNNNSNSFNTYQTSNYAGQSYGAYLDSSVKLEHFGYANDYVGKGLSGGQIIIKNPTNNYEAIIAGNTCLYGATKGSCYLEGSVGERFAVRNSGGIAINHGMGNHACEYMTGGVVICLGEFGINLGAGMSGGHLYLYKAKDLALKLNQQSVQSFSLKANHQLELIEILKAYEQATNNELVKAILNNIDLELENFTLITSQDYYDLERGA